MEQPNLQNITDDTPPLEPLSSDIGYENLVQKTDEGYFGLSLLISGVHCAGCIQKIESTLLAEQNIQKARLNFSTNRLNFEWNGQANQADHLVQLIQNLGYGVKPYDAAVQKNEQLQEERFLLLCLGVAGFAMGNIMLMSFGLWMTDSATMGTGTRDLMHWIQALIALPTIFYAGRPFFRSAFTALSNGHTNMDVPISLALILATLMSLYESFNHGQHVYFDSAVMLMFFLLIGRYLDFRARKKARTTATDLLSTLQGFARVRDGEKTKTVPIRDLKEGMEVYVAVGEKLPIDGQIIEGQTQVDTTLVTGETLPRDMVIGDDVYAGTINLSAPVIIQVAKAAEDSLLADIVRLMEQASQSQAAYVRLADKAAKLYTPFVHTIALLSFLGWILLGGIAWQDALLIAITVLIITCPCALGLAVPVVQVLATGKLMAQGILVKSGDALERLARIDTIMLDKTGTLTRGQPSLQQGYDEEMLSIAASLASYSQHPLSVALRKAYQGEELKIDKVEEIKGKGLTGVYQGQTIKLGSRDFIGTLKEEGLERIELWFKYGKQEPIVFYLDDQIRTDTADTITRLKNNGLTPLMVTGDRQIVAQNIAKQAGIKEVKAEQTPIDKYGIMQGLKERGHNVLMVGDGLNDAPVLAGADVSMAPGTAIDMAQNAADIVFMGDRLMPVAKAYDVAVHSQKLVRQNFTLAVLYNIIAVPIAIAGFATPMVAAIAMSGSSLIVIANSFRLKFRS